MISETELNAQKIERLRQEGLSNVYELSEKDAATDFRKFIKARTGKTPIFSLASSLGAGKTTPVVVTADKDLTLILGRYAFLCTRTSQCWIKNNHILTTRDSVLRFCYTDPGLIDLSVGEVTRRLHAVYQIRDGNGDTPHFLLQEGADKAFKITETRQSSEPRAPAKTDEAFAGLHGRPRYFGEPADGLRLKLFKDEPVVVNSQFFPNRAFALHLTRYNGPEIMYNSKKIFHIDEVSSQYLQRLTAREFSERYKDLDIDGAATLLVIDNYFDSLLTSRQASAVRELILTQKICAEDVRGCLYIKKIGREYSCVATARTDAARDLFVAQVILGRPFQTAKKTQETKTMAEDFSR